MIAKLKEFFVAGRGAEDHLLLHISEIDTLPRTVSFFAFARVTKSDKATLQMLQTLIKELHITTVQAKGEKPDNPLEHVIASINASYSDRLAEIPDDTDIVVGILDCSQLSFAYRGLPEIGVYASKQGTYQRIIDNTPEIDPKRLFSSVLEGTISANYIFLCTTRISFENIEEHISHICSAKKIDHIIQNIEQELYRSKPSSYCGGIVIIKQSNPTPTSPLPSKVHTKREKQKKLSRPSRYSTPRATSSGSVKNLKLSSNKNKKRIIPRSKYLTPSPHINRTFYQAIAKETVINRILIILGKTLVTLFTSLRSVCSSIWGSIVSIILFITNRGDHRRVVIQSVNDEIYAKRQEIRDLPLTSKVIFICTLIITLIFIGSLAHLRINKNAAIRQSIYENARTRITTAIEKASNIAILDKTEAITIFTQIEQDIAALSPENIYKTDLQALLEMTLRDIQNITETESPLFIDLMAIYPNVQSNEIILSGDKLITFRPASSQITVIDRDTRTTNAVLIDSNYTLTSGTAGTEGKILFHLASGDLATLDLTTKQFELLDFDVRIRAITTDISFYNGKIYSIDVEKNQIYKHNQTQTGYARGTEWLVEKETALLSGTNLAVDGSVFVLTASGTLSKYFRGTPATDFRIKDLSPAIASGADLWVHPDVPYVYILDAIERRIISLTKQGRFVAQYTAKEWLDPTSFTIDHTRQIGYVLSSGNIYTFPLK